MSRREEFSDALVFRAAELFCNEPALPATAIADRLNEEFRVHPRLTRETAYELVIAARERKRLRLLPPLDPTLSQALASEFKLAADTIHVVNVMNKESNSFVAACAAELVYSLLTKRAADPKRATSDGVIGLGLGPGRATLDFSRHLGDLFRHGEHEIKLRLTAIAAGCPALEPENAPASMFALYPPSSTVERIGFFAQSLMLRKEFESERFRDSTGVREAFAERDERIHLVVTSMGDFDDEDDLLSSFLRQSGVHPEVALKECLGSVQYRPYTATGPFTEPKDVPRAVTLFELDDFVRMAAEGKDVVLVSRRCGKCGKVHAKPLIPLLERPELKVWSHLVLDTLTALEVLVLRNRAVADAERARIERAARVFRAADLFSDPVGHTAKEIADCINKDMNTSPKVSREMVYTLVANARSEKYLRFQPPIETTLAREIASTFHLDPDTIRVVDTPTPASNALVAARAAEWVFDLATALMSRLEPLWKSSNLNEKRRGVGLGLGPGRATLDFSRSFGELLARREPALRLRLISIASGSPATDPEFSSANFFNLYPSRFVNQRVGLFAETLMHQNRFESKEFRQSAGVCEAFEEKNEQRVDIIVNSMGDLTDPHDLLSRFLTDSKTTGPSFVEQLKDCAGSVQYRPYSTTGPIVEPKGVPRAVTLYELSDFVNLARSKNKHVVLIARRCGQCGRTRAASLLPLLKVPALKVWSELILDTATARELLAGRKDTSKESS
ncbi:MAG: hypothetical protein U0794_01075 [Isosphaeraceae bacterium]